ncbi:MAG: hypothetical protein BRD55_01350 [Bacteroidetes bacterium SW_9_63_38]|nr:MAG: hypothetical protein BRD55_01350 [Bacteroidetes bacterium SW_9_63_38]
MPPDQRREWFEAEQKRKREASVESQLGEHEKGVRLKSGAFDRPLEDDDVLRGVAARLNKIASPGGEGTAELDLRDIELPPDTSEGRLYEDAEQSFEEAKEWIIEHTRHVIHLHADLLILDQVLQHARPLLELTRKCISKQKEEHPPNVGGASHEAVILIGTDLIEEMQVFEDGLPGWMLENRETFYRHAGQVVAEERERDERYSNGAVIRWLKQTDCWASERQGKTGPLREVIENVIGYTKEYGDLS